MIETAFHQEIIFRGHVEMRREGARASVKTAAECLYPGHSSRSSPRESVSSEPGPKYEGGGCVRHAGVGMRMPRPCRANAVPL
jgi:hypothetical protein